MKLIYKDRYVLGEGDPWYVLQPEEGCYIGLNGISSNHPMKKLKIPKILFYGNNCPKYRLVLERVK